MDPGCWGYPGWSLVRGLCHQNHQEEPDPLLEACLEAG